MPPQEAASQTKPSRRLERFLASLIGLIIFVAAAAYGLAYVLSPATIRHPAHTHYHFRLILINNGQAVNFADNSFQTAFNKDICSAALTKEPIHFHDNVDQYGHIHWAGMTGGMLLKDYGWNFIGGFTDALGYRFDQGIVPRRVPIHSYALPQRIKSANYYIYIGTPTSHKQASWNDFLHEDLQTFLKGSPVIDPSEDAQLKALDMTRADMNDVVGNMVIFAQSSAPTDQQVTDQFKKLKPLPESPCEG